MQSNFFCRPECISGALKIVKNMTFSSFNLPVSPEEQEIPLIMNGDDLAALKFGKWWESCLKHSSNGMTQAGSKTIQYEFRVMRRCSPVALGKIQCQFGADMYTAEPT